jgi:predicted nucleotidyltransferase
MLPGYNQERPVERNYLDFEEKLINGLEELDLEGLSLMTYGSFVRGDYNPGRSDIDAVMTFPDDVVINKENLSLVGKVLQQALRENNVPFQVSVTDLTTMRDGRFNTYDESFYGYFQEEGKIIVGPDYRAEFCYELPTMNEQIPVRFNLRKSRIGLLFAEHYREEDYESFLGKFTKTLDSVSRGSKQILYFFDGELRKNRFAAEAFLQNTFPTIDVEPLLKIKELYHDPAKLDSLYRQPEEVLKLWNSSVTFFEEMIREYIKKHPKA